jgi:hypothetical protein
MTYFLTLKKTAPILSPKISTKMQGHQMPKKIKNQDARCRLRQIPDSLVFWAVRHKYNDNDHWTCYINDKELKKIIWIEIDHELNINKAEPKCRKAALDYVKTKKSKIKKVHKPKTNKYLKCNEMLDGYINNFEQYRKDKLERGKLDQDRFNKQIKEKYDKAERLLEYFGDMTIKEITYDIIDSYVKERIRKSNRKTLGKGTLANDLSVLSAASQFTIENLTVNKKYKTLNKESPHLTSLKNIISIYRKNKEMTTTKILEESEKTSIDYFTYRKIIDFIKYKQQDILRGKTKIDPIFVKLYIYMYWTGARCGNEVLFLKPEHIKFDKNNLPAFCELPAHLTKDGKPRSFEYFIDVKKALAGLDFNDNEYVFTIRGKRISRYQYDRPWKIIRKHFDLRYPSGKYIRAHSFRNSFIDNIALSENIREFTGQSQRMIDHYFTDNTKQLNTLIKLELWKEEQENKYKNEFRRLEGEKALKLFFGT